MRVLAPADAPDWAHKFAQNITQAIDNSIWPYARRAPIAKADLPPAGPLAFQKFYLTDGTSGRTEATSDGTNWRYADGGIV